MKKSILVILFVFCLGLFSATSGSAQQTVPQIVVSIKPIHALVAGVMQGVAEPKLLISGGGSPHSYALRPSEARALSRADLVIWVGPQLETFLEKSLTTLGKNARQLELVKALKSDLLHLREGGNWETHSRSHDEHVAGHGEGEDLNPHLWLDPILAGQVVNVVAAALIEIDPKHLQQYLDNTVQLKQRLNRLHAHLKTKLNPVKHIPYVVFHDAYQYFETAYGLNAVGSVTVNPERKPGAKRIIQMRQKIIELNARCVFSEPQFEPKLVSTVIEGTGARVGVLDPLGTELSVGPDSYFKLMNALVDSLVTGLQ